MYRCYLTQQGRVLKKRKLDVDSLSEAITTAHQLLEEMACSHDLDGIEIWEGERLLYGSAGPANLSTTANNHKQK